MREVGSDVHEGREVRGRGREAEGGWGECVQTLGLSRKW